MKNRAVLVKNDEDANINVVSSSTSTPPIDASSSASSSSSASTSRDEETQPKSVISGVDDADVSTSVSKVKSASKRRRLVYEDEEEVCGKGASKVEEVEEDEEEEHKGNKRTKSGGRPSLERQRVAKEARTFLDLEAKEEYHDCSQKGDWGRRGECSDTEGEAEEEEYEHDDKENRLPTRSRNTIKTKAQIHHRQDSPYPRRLARNNDDDDDDDDDVMTQESDEELDRQASVFHNQSMKAGRFPPNKSNGARKLGEAMENIEGKISTNKKKPPLEL